MRVRVALRAAEGNTKPKLNQSPIIGHVCAGEFGQLIRLGEYVHDAETNDTCFPRHESLFLLVLRISVLT